eukprot:jgi/Tetstr1/447938/TSEL_035244.t1
MDSPTQARSESGFRSNKTTHFGSAREHKSPSTVSPYLHSPPVIVGGTRSQFGPQTESFKRTPPSIGFGTGPKFKSDKQFISNKHSEALPPTWSPGPGTYKARSSIGNQPESFRSNPRHHGFIKDERFSSDQRERKMRGEMPSPGDYEAAISCLGPQTQSKTGNSIPVRFGTSTRDVNICQKGFEVPFYGKDSPGPKYGAGHGAFGDQPYAHRRNAARISFTKDMKSTDPAKPNDRERYTGALPGPNEYQVREKIGRGKPKISFCRDTREHAHTVSLSPAGAEALWKGRGSPGPNYHGHPSVGIQNEAGKRNSTVSRFPKASRFPKSQVDDTPGPGAYTT